MVYSNLQNNYLGKKLICSQVPMAREESENGDFLVMGRRALYLKAGCFSNMPCRLCFFVNAVFLLIG